MFIVTWLFAKLGYMPKIDFEVGKIDLDLKNTWPFPVEIEKPKLTAKKATTRKPRTAVKKPAVVAKTARKPKAK